MERQWDVPVQGHGCIFLEAVLQSAEQDLELHVRCRLHLSHSSHLRRAFGMYVNLWAFSDSHLQRRACPHRRCDTTDFLLHGGRQPTNSLRIHSKEWLGGCYKVSQYSLELWLTTTRKQENEFSAGMADTVVQIVMLYLLMKCTWLCVSQKATYYRVIY